MPLYPAYEITQKPGDGANGIEIDEMIANAQADAGFTKEWKDALAIAAAAAKNFDTLSRVQIAPRSAVKLVAVDGVHVTDVGDIATGEGPYVEPDVFRLPMLGTVASLFTDQLRVLDIKDKQTVSAFRGAKGLCKDTLWAARSTSKESASHVQALVLGRCARVEGREGSWNARVLELVVFDANGRAVLVVGDGHVDAYRWATDGGKPMIAGARSLLMGGTIVEAKKREAVAAK
jgi:hypothetical protein